MHPFVFQVDKDALKCLNMVKVLDYHVNNGVLKEMKKMEDLN